MVFTLIRGYNLGVRFQKKPEKEELSQKIVKETDKKLQVCCIEKLVCVGPCWEKVMRIFFNIHIQKNPCAVVKMLFKMQLAV